MTFVGWKFSYGQSLSGNLTAILNFTVTVIAKSGKWVLSGLYSNAFSVWSHYFWPKFEDFLPLLYLVKRFPDYHDFIKAAFTSYLYNMRKLTRLLTCRLGVAWVSFYSFFLLQAKFLPSCAQVLLALCVSEQNNLKISNLALFVFTYVRSHNSLMSSAELIYYFY